MLTGYMHSNTFVGERVHADVMGFKTARKRELKANAPRISARFF